MRQNNAFLRKYRYIGRSNTPAVYRRGKMKRLIVFCALLLLLTTQAVAQETILLAAEDDWYPYSAKKGSRVEGRSVDIVQAAYEAVGAELALDVVPFNRGMMGTKRGHYAGVFNAGLNDDVRRDYLIPRNTIALSEQVVVARVGEPFQGIASFSGKRLALTLGYTYPTDITGDTRIHIERAFADINNLKKIAANRADFTIIDRLVLLSILVTEPALKREVGIVGKLESDKIYLVFAKNASGEKALRLFDQGMDKINRNGVLKKIESSWEDRLR
jgi:polar amino acid transport system substrate-binding protein